MKIIDPREIERLWALVYNKVLPFIRKVEAEKITVRCETDNEEVMFLVSIRSGDSEVILVFWPNCKPCKLSKAPGG